MAEQSCALHALRSCRTIGQSQRIQARPTHWEPIIGVVSLSASGRTRIGAVVLTASIMWVGRAAALDPDRRIYEYGQRVFGVEAGLPQITITAIAQTPDGFLWVGTEGGLARFDGLRFTVVDQSGDGASDRAAVSALVVDRAGTLWIGRKEAPGLVRYREGRFDVVREPAELASAGVTALAEDRNGIWVSARGRIVHLSRSGPARVFGPPDHAAPLDFFALAEDPEGNVWVANAKGLFRFDQKGFEQVVGMGEVDHRVLHGLAFGSDGSLWVGTSGVGVLRLSGGYWQVLGANEGLPSLYARHLFGDRDGNLWVATAMGLARWRGQHFEVYSVAEGLPDNEVTTLFEDRERSLWLGTRAAGLVRLRDLPATRFSTRDGLVGDPLVETVLPHREGGLWVGSRRGIARLGPVPSRELTGPDDPCASWLWSLLEDRQGRLWAGTRGPEGGKLCRFEGDRVVQLGGGLAPDEAVRTIYQDRRARVWIGGRRLYLMEDDRARPVPAAALAESAGDVVDLVEDHDGVLWLATRHGLWQSVDGERWRAFQPEGQPLANVHDLHVDAGGLWLATGRGLARIVEGQLQRLSEAAGLSDDSVFSLIDDTRGQLWLCTGKGLVRLPKRGLPGIGEKPGSFRYAEYDHADGLKPPYCQAGGNPRAARTSDGRLWFVTPRGLIVVDPAKATANPVPPEVAIESVEVDGAEVPWRTTESVPRGLGRVQITFTATTLAAAERARFRYRLAPFDRDWVEAGTRRVAYYTNLPAQRYRFQVIASNADGLWNERGASLALSLEPPVYATFPFRAALALLAVALVLGSAWGFHRRRLNRLRIHHSAVMGERSRLARELHDTLAQALTGIIMQLEAAAGAFRSAPSRAQAHLEKARALAGQSLGEARRAIWDLRNEALVLPHDLRAALEQEVRRMDLPLDVSVEVEGEPRPLSSPLRAALVRIAQEGMVNVVKHAGATRMSLALRFSAEEIVLRIQDDGIGFSERDEAVRTQGHFGLIGMRERARAFGGKISVERAPGGGTELKVIVPTGTEPRRDLA
jgi:signal transduction histidine kinase/ligand-binding sensor domain-containing protein